MSVFVKKLNPMNGINDWVIQNEEYDYHQDVARASFADMLHDEERNRLYEQALKVAINKMHACGRKANVLDIGTGTGLLSMMAARNGADSVVACEAFKPMSECAVKIITVNGFQDKIRVIAKRSTNLTVGEKGDIIERCNILVTEVFDTELIGEGALSTFDHAHKHLLEEDSIVIPESAMIFAQVVECPLAQNWNKVQDISNCNDKILIYVPDSIKNCAGSSAVHDIQLNQLPLGSINTIIAPTPILYFDLSGKMPITFHYTTICRVKSKCDGRAQAVFMWWNLQMDKEGKLILSCAPYWARPSTEKNTVKIPWRDHWMQAIYYLPNEVPVKKSQEINLISCHDEYSLWFNLTQNKNPDESCYLKPICECAIHVAFSRTRIGQINDSKRNQKFLSVLKKHVSSKRSVLILSDGFYFGLVAAKLGAKKVYFIETQQLTRRILLDFIYTNNLNNVEVIPTSNDLNKIDLKNINIVFGEPYFINSILPWDNLLFIYLVKGIYKHLPSDVKIFPCRASIKGIAVHFSDLYKIRCPLGTCKGFLMKHFDDLIEKASSISDDNVEAQPLWEYPAVALSKEVEIVNLDLVNFPETLLECQGLFEIQGNLDCNGIALWIDWFLEDSESTIISTGPNTPTVIGEKIHWDMYTRQGVCLFANKDCRSVNYTFKFDFNEGNVTFNFK